MSSFRLSRIIESRDCFVELLRRALELKEFELVAERKSVKIYELNFDNLRLEYASRGGAPEYAMIERGNNSALKKSIGIELIDDGIIAETISSFPNLVREYDWSYSSSGVNIGVCDGLIETISIVLSDTRS